MLRVYRGSTEASGPEVAESPPKYRVRAGPAATSHWMFNVIFNRYFPGQFDTHSRWVVIMSELEAIYGTLTTWLDK